MRGLGTTCSAQNRRIADASSWCGCYPPTAGWTRNRQLNEIEGDRRLDENWGSNVLLRREHDSVDGYRFGGEASVVLLLSPISEARLEKNTHKP